MRYSKRLSYLYNLISVKKIIFFSLISFLFEVFNLSFQYFRMGQKFGNLSILLFGQSGIFYGALNGFILLFYLLPLFGLAVFIKKWTLTPFFLINSKRKTKVFGYQTFTLFFGILFYFLIIVIGIFLAYLLIMQFGIIPRSQVSWELSEVFKILIFKYIQFVLIGQLVLLGTMWINEYIVLLAILASFVYCMVQAPPFISLVFFLDRRQMLSGNFYFNNLLFLVLVIIVIILLSITTHKYTDRGSLVDA